MRHTLCLSVLVPPPGLGTHVTRIGKGIHHVSPSKARRDVNRASIDRWKKVFIQPQSQQEQPSHPQTPQQSEQPQDPTHANEASALFKNFVQFVNLRSSPFTSFASRLLSDEVEKLEGRNRDILPLPRASISDVPWPLELSREQASIYTAFMNIAVAGLNWLHRGGSSCKTPGKATSLHKRVFRTLASKVCKVAELLNETGPSDYIGRSFEDLVREDASTKYPDCCARKVDFIEECGLVDPLEAVPDEIRELFACHQNVFPDGGKQLPKMIWPRAADKEEYLKLVIRLLRARKVELHLEVSAAAPTFNVAKKASGKQREIWSGSHVSRCAVRPPPPPKLANPAALSGLFASTDRPLYVSGRDGLSWFDQLLAPEQIRKFLGRPAFLVADLLNVAPIDGSEVTLSEIQSFCLNIGEISRASILIPVARVLPMGFSWSSYFAQSYMLDCISQLDFHSDVHILHEAGVQVSPESPAISVATDDIMLFQRAPAGTKSADLQYSLNSLDDIWDHRGVLGNDFKSFDGSNDCTSLGIELRGGSWLGPRSGRLKYIFACVLALDSSRMASPEDISMIVGMFTWHHLLARSLLSCFHRVYGFIGAPPFKSPRRVSGNILSELALSLALSPFWIVDLTRNWLPEFTCTDAATSFGYGMCIAKCDEHILRQAANFASVGSHYVHIDSPEDPFNRQEPRFDLPLHVDDFRQVLSLRAQQKDHAVAMEGRCVLLAVQRLSRKQYRHGARLLLGVDAQAVLYALRKGRSSAPGLRRLVSAISATILAADMLIMYAYVPSICNPADAPSRGTSAVRRSTMRAKQRYLKSQKETSIAWERLRSIMSRRGILVDESDWSPVWSTWNHFNC